MPRDAALRPGAVVAAVLPGRAELGPRRDLTMLTAQTGEIGLEPEMLVAEERRVRPGRTPRGRPLLDYARIGYDLLPGDCASELT